MKDIEVKYAVIPCAGRGTRFLPITKGVPKEMCPIVDRPTLDYIIEECIDSGIEEIVLIVSEGKDDIKKYYSYDKEYEEELESKGKITEKNLIHRIATKCKLHFILQEELLGLGHAVLLSKEIIKDNNFVVCCGDDICTYKKDNPPVKQLIKAFKIGDGSTIVGGQKVPHKDIVKYGSMDIKDGKNGLYSLKGIIEKPSLDEAPSDFASLGKWVFNPSIYETLENTPKGKGGEIQLTDAIALLIKKEKVYFCEFDGRRYDCGDKLGYLTAIIDIALNRDDLKDGLIKHLESLKL